jgi:hypothetical protein
MKIHNTSDASIKPSILMMVYGQGGVGKSTFTATAPKPIMADCENGSKYFGLRGIHMDVALIQSWADIQEFYKAVRESEYDTVIVDPIGELMEKLKIHIINSKEKKWVQYDGSLTMAGWGEMKERMRMFVKSIKDLNKHMIIVAHVEEKDDEGKLIKRPRIMTKISEELIALVDVVGFMEVVRQVGADGETIDKRIIRVSPSEKYESKDRTGQLGGIIEPDFMKIINACQGNEVYSWSSKKALDDNAAKTDKANNAVPPVAPEQPETTGEATPEQLKDLPESTTAPVEAAPSEEEMQGEAPAETEVEKTTKKAKSKLDTALAK